MPMTDLWKTSTSVAPAKLIDPSLELHWAAQFLAAGVDVAVTDPEAGAEARARKAISEYWPVLERLGFELDERLLENDGYERALEAIAGDLDIPFLDLRPALRAAVTDVLQNPPMTPRTTSSATNATATAVRRRRLRRSA